MQVTNLKHFLNVVIFALEELPPRGQVAVGENAARFQQPVCVTLQANVRQEPIIYSASDIEIKVGFKFKWFLMDLSLAYFSIEGLGKTDLDEVKLVSMPGIFW